MENMPALVTQLFAGVASDTFTVVLIITLFFLFCGLWLDASISIILFAPIVLPLAASAGLHPVQLGIMLIVNCVLGLITPPIGNVLFVVSNVARLSIASLSRALLPFIVVGFCVVMLIGLWPDLTLALPRAFGLIRP
jgi:TRAP-type C4-dicarboxylate transport system permease large subunit